MWLNIKHVTHSDIYYRNAVCLICFIELIACVGYLSSQTPFVMKACNNRTLSMSSLVFERSAYYLRALVG